MTERDKSAKHVAMVLLLFISVYVFSPLSFLVNVPVAQAECGPGGCGGDQKAGLGSLLGGEGGLQNAMMLMLIMSMLMQLFQGGSTPQQGTAEETAPLPASIGPTQTGARSTTNNGSGTSAASSGLANQSLFLATSGTNAQVLAPATLIVSKGNGFNFFNATDADQLVRIYNTNTPTAALNQTVLAGSAQVFYFQNSGTFKVCMVKNSVEDCKSTITVP